MDRIEGRVCLLDDKGHTHCGQLTQASQKVICSLFEPKPKTILLREGLVEEMWQSGERMMHDQREAIRGIMP